MGNNHMVKPDQKDDTLFGVPKNLFIAGCAIIVILLIAAALVTTLLTKFGREDSAARYPASTLSHEASSSHEYIKSEFLSKTLGCPSLPYNINVPDNLISSSNDYVVTDYNNCQIVLYESSQDAMTALTGTLGKVCVESIDIPDVEWKDELSDVGYINGYSAEYHAGRFRITTKISSDTYYSVSYRITFEDEDKAVFVEAVTPELSNLQAGKDVIDAMLFTLTKVQTEESGAETETTESTEEPSDEPSGTTEAGEDIEFMETKPTDLYSKDFEVYVREDMPELFVVFTWENVTTSPSVLNVTSPDGRVFEIADEYSSDGVDVFYIPDAPSGTYIIHGEVAGTIYGCSYEALSKEAFYVTYLNMDPDTGEPAAYFDEDADFSEDTSYDDEDSYDDDDE